MKVIIFLILKIQREFEGEFSLNRLKENEDFVSLLNKI